MVKISKDLLRCFLLLLSFSALADFDDRRAAFNLAYSNFLKGDCDSIVHPSCQVTGDPMNMSSLRTFVNNVNPVVYSEDMFFSKAGAHQIDFLRCDINQLDKMTKRDAPSIKFQSTVLGDIYQKLPEMRAHYRIMMEKQAIVSEYQKEIEAQYASVSRSLKTLEQAQAVIDEINKKMAVELEVLQPESAAFHTILSSIWRADDPIMGDFIMRMVGSSRSPQELYTEAMRPTAADGYLRQWTGTAEFSFQEQVLDKMKSEASKSLENLVGQGGNYDFSTKKTLVRDSEWAENMNQSSLDGETANAKLMCVLDKKYVSGDDATITTLEVGSMLLGGVGALTKVFSAGKFARLLNPGAVRALLMASRVTTVASMFTMAPAVVDTINSSCFGNSPSVIARGANRCDPNDLGQYEEVERKRIEQENCALSVIMGAVMMVPAERALAGARAVKEMNFSQEFMSRFSGFRVRGARAVAREADEAIVALARAEQEAKALAASEEVVEEIVVVAKPKKTPRKPASSRPSSPEPAPAPAPQAEGIADDVVELEVVNADVFDSEIEKIIGRKPNLEEREAFIEILERTQAVGKDREAFFATRSPEFKEFHDKWRLELAKNPEQRKALRRQLTEVGESRLLSGQDRLKREVDELAASGKVEVGRDGKPAEIDCAVLNRFYGGAFPKEGKCYRVKAKEDINGEYCGCGAANKRAFGFTLKCPKTAEEFRTLTQYFDHIALPTVSKLQMCARVDIPKGKECYTGNTTLTFAGYGGGTQLLCIDSTRFADKQSLIDEFGIDVGGKGAKITPRRWSPFSDFESMSAIIHDASAACPERCSPQNYMRLMGNYKAELGRLERQFAGDPEKLRRLSEEKILFDEYFQNLRNGRQDLPSEAVMERLSGM